MAEYKTKLFKAALRKKGFRRDKLGHGDNHIWYRLYVGGKASKVETCVSKGEKNYGDTLLAARRKQIKLDGKTDFMNFLACKENYEQYLRDRGIDP